MSVHIPSCLWLATLVHISLGIKVSLVRKELPPALEPLIQSKKTMADVHVRQVIATNPLVGLVSHYKMLCRLYSAVCQNTEPVQVKVAASEADIASCFQII